VGGRLWGHLVHVSSYHVHIGTLRTATSCDRRSGLWLGDVPRISGTPPSHTNRGSPCIECAGSCPAPGYQKTGLSDACSRPLKRASRTSSFLNRSGRSAFLCGTYRFAPSAAVPLQSSGGEISRAYLRARARTPSQIFAGQHRQLPTSPRGRATHTPTHTPTRTARLLSRKRASSLQPPASSLQPPVLGLRLQ